MFQRQQGASGALPQLPLEWMVTFSCNFHLGLFILHVPYVYLVMQCIKIETAVVV
jgi:hypothetical protein